MAGTRDHYLDALRGVCVLSMVFGHVAQETWLARLNLAQTVGFFSGAEGFLFLAGFVFGKVYAKRVATLGTDASLRSVLSRVGRLYAIHLAILACLLVAARLTPTTILAMSETYRPAAETPWQAFTAGVLGTYQPRLLDILPLYIALLPIGWLLIWRRWDQGLRLPVISLAIWALQQFPEFAFGENIFPGAFDGLSYQLLFFLGLWVARGGLTGAAGALRSPRLVFWISAAGTAGCFLASHPKLLGFSHGPSEALARFALIHARKRTLGWLRLGNFLAAAFSVRRIRPWCPDWLVAPLASLGRRSLEVFVGHVGLLLLLCWPLARLREASAADYALLVLASVSVAAAGLWLKDRRRWRSRSSSSRDLPP